MLDTLTATSAPAPGGVRSLVDRDEYGPLSGHAGGLFTVPVAPVVLLGRARRARAPARRLGARRRPALTPPARRRRAPRRAPAAAARAQAAAPRATHGPSTPTRLLPAARARQRPGARGALERSLTPLRQVGIQRQGGCERVGEALGHRHQVALDRGDRRRDVCTRPRALREGVRAEPGERAARRSRTPRGEPLQRHDSRRRARAPPARSTRRSARPAPRAPRASRGQRRLAAPRRTAAIDRQRAAPAPAAASSPAPAARADSRTARRRADATPGAASTSAARQQRVQAPASGSLLAGVQSVIATPPRRT